MVGGSQDSCYAPSSWTVKAQSQAKFSKEQWYEISSKHTTIYWLQVQVESFIINHPLCGRTSPSNKFLIPFSFWANLTYTKVSLIAQSMLILVCSRMHICFFFKIPISLKLDKLEIVNEFFKVPEKCHERESISMLLCNSCTNDICRCSNQCPITWNQKC